MKRKPVTESTWLEGQWYMRDRAKGRTAPKVTTALGQC